MGWQEPLLLRFHPLAEIIDIAKQFQQTHRWIPFESGL